MKYLQHLFHWMIPLILITFSLDLPQLLLLSLMMMVMSMQSLVYIILYDHSTSIPSEAVIGFVPAAYSVVEGTDRFANLTVQLISGQLGHEVIVNFNTQSGSATSTINTQ